MKFKGQRQKLPSLCPELRWHLTVWAVWHGHNCMDIISYKRAWKMLPQQNWGLLTVKERMDTSGQLALQCLPLPSSQR